MLLEELCHYENQWYNRVLLFAYGEMPGALGAVRGRVKPVV